MAKINATLLGGKPEREERVCMLSQLLFLLNLLPERCFAIFMAGVLARRKNRKTFSSSLLPLCVSVPLAQRVVNHIRRAGALLFNGRSNK